jgi:hypothetical protein
VNILQVIKQLIRFRVWAKFKANIYPSFYYSHSQFAEDMIVRFLTHDKNKGFYVDIGAFHPVLLSNTYHFYCKGWQGINVDARAGSMDLFKVLRPRDINLELCISDKEEDVSFFTFEQSPFDTCNQETAEQLISSGSVKLVSSCKLKTLTLKSVLKRYLPKDTEIDFMSIDVEGMDEIVLMSNDWDLFKPKILVFEKHKVSFQDAINSSIVKYLEQFGYEFVTKSGFSIILVQKDYLSINE